MGYFGEDCSAIGGDPTTTGWIDHTCGDCEGSGEGDSQCQTCQGCGMYYLAGSDPIPMGYDEDDQETVDFCNEHNLEPRECGSCDGSGEVCSGCAGSGYCICSDCC